MRSSFSFSDAKNDETESNSGHEKSARSVAQIVLSICAVVVIAYGCSSWVQLHPRVPTVADAVYVGKETCQICHAGQVAEVERTAHARMEHHELPVPNHGCESCHGPGSRHVQKRGSRDEIRRFGVALEQESVSPASDELIVGYRAISLQDKLRAAEYCLSCHNRQTHFEWPGSRHEMEGVTCIDCHNPMKATRRLLRHQEPELCYTCHPERRAQAHYPSHHPIEEGQLLCSDCHNQHGSTSHSMLRADTTNELCYRCHGEKEGPFLFEHPPASESCTICHEPHGTIANNLIRETEPFLCLGCHAGHQGPIPPLSDVVLVEEKRATFYTKCTQCHSTIHGTDTPSTSGHGRFTR